MSSTVDQKRASWRARAKKVYERNPEPIRERNRRYRDENRDRINAQQREYLAARKKNDPEWVVRDAARKLAWYYANKEKALKGGRISRLKSQYGVDQARFDQMMEEQGGLCAICARAPRSWHGRLVVDHCHETNIVRGLLCDDCNVGLGRLGDGDVSRLRAALDYIERAYSESKSA